MRNVKDIVLLTTKYANDKKDAWLTNELAYSILEDGHRMYAIVFSWLKSDPASSVDIIDGVKVIRIKLPSFFYSSGFIGTALKIFIFPFLARHQIRKHIGRCDLLIANTPCVTILGMSSFFKKRYAAKTFLVLWDFFPYYLKDLGAIRNKFFFGFFRYLEQVMYQSFDRIGCMTEGNSRFLIEHFPTVERARITILPIWAKIKTVDAVDRSLVRSKYGISTAGFVAVYGGAMSIVQELDNILDLAGRYQGSDVNFLFIGRGTEVENLKQAVLDRELSNVQFIDYVPRDEYQSVVQACDVGIISLSKKLTVPSFPSKSLDYFKVCLPILASLDSVTDFGDILEVDIGAGYAVRAGDTDRLKAKMDLLVADPVLRARLGANGRRYYEQNLNVERAKKIITSGL